MRIREIEFGRVQSIPNSYNNVRVSFRAEVQEKESVDAVLNSLKAMVETKINDEISKSDSMLERYNALIKKKQEQLEKLSARIRKFQEFLKDEDEWDDTMQDELKFDEK